MKGRGVHIITTPNARRMQRSSSGLPPVVGCSVAYLARCPGVCAPGGDVCVPPKMERLCARGREPLSAGGLFRSRAVAGSAPCPLCACACLEVVQAVALSPAVYDRSWLCVPWSGSERVPASVFLLRVPLGAHAQPAPPQRAAPWPACKGGDHPSFAIALAGARVPLRFFMTTDARQVGAVPVVRLKSMRVGEVLRTARNMTPAPACRAGASGGVRRCVIRVPLPGDELGGSRTRAAPSSARGLGVWTPVTLPSVFLRTEAGGWLSLGPGNGFPLHLSRLRRSPAVCLDVGRRTGCQENLRAAVL